MRTSSTHGAFCALLPLLLCLLTSGCGEGLQNAPLQIAEVRGRVVGADPLSASVTVLLEDDGGENDAAEREVTHGALLTTGVDAQGRFVLHEVPATRITLYVVGSPGRAAHLRLEVPGARVTDVGDVLLEDAASITVRALDEAGNPVPGAEVEVDQTPFDSRGVDATGNVSFGPLVPGCYRVRAKADHYEETEANVCVATGQALQLSLTLRFNP